MHVTQLSLSNFRNYARLESRLPESPVVIHGANAQGKTSLLEAIYYLATGRSPYTSSDRQLLNWSVEDQPLPFARIAADVTRRDGQRFRLETTLTLTRSSDGQVRFKRAVRLNGVDKRVMDIIGLLNVVLFLPRDMTLVEGPPADRRRFMDATLCQMAPDYAVALEAYERVVPQRNALLRRIADNQASPSELTYWDAQVVAHGSQLIAARQRFLRELEAEAQRNHYDLTGRRETLTLRYQPSFQPGAQVSNGTQQMAFDVLGLDLHRDLDPAQIEPQFADHLAAQRHESIRRGMTLSGPHRDELRLHINERDAGLYGSRGQARTAVLALKLAERQWMRARSGEYPVLLLDEVAAELDRDRRRYLLERVSDDTQTLLTTAALDGFSDAFLGRAAVWRIEAGRLMPAS